eukprot:3934219-Rhodomonas_salina.1
MLLTALSKSWKNWVSSSRSDDLSLEESWSEIVEGWLDPQSSWVRPTDEGAWVVNVIANVLRDGINHEAVWKRNLEGLGEREQDC